MSKKSLSIGRSSNLKSALLIHQTKSEPYSQSDYAEPNNIKDAWYQHMCINKTNSFLPLTVPTYNHTEPYRLTITKIANLNIPKKSSQSHQFVHLQAFFITSELQVIGKKVIHQCEEEITEGKFEYPISFYYHSKVDRNSSYLKMLVTLYLVEERNGVIEGKYKLGMTLISDPLLEKSIKSCTVFKDCSELDLLVNSSPTSLQTASCSVSFQIQSYLELKMITKMIPGECIVTSTDHIGGIFEGSLPNSDACEEIIEQQFTLIKVLQLQIHIPEKFQQQILNSAKKIPEIAAFASPVVTSRRLIIGFHNSYQFVAPTQRKLQFLQHEATGQFKMGVYQFISEGEVVKIPCYIDEDGNFQPETAFAASLLFEINGIQVQTAIFMFDPKINGSKEEISINMVSGPGQGIMGNLLHVTTDRRPTFIMDYISEQVQTDRTGEDDFRSQSRQRLKSNYKLPLKSQKNVTSHHEVREHSRILEEVQMQRLELEKQKQALDAMRSQNFMAYQEEFERRLQEEKEELHRRQNLLQQHYRRQVEKQFQRKMQLEHKIREMKEKISDMEEKEKHRFASKKLSYEQSPHEAYEEQYQVTGGFENQRQRVQPIHLQEEKNPEPAYESRQFNSQKLKRQSEIEAEYKQFNHASKITFNFTSIVWSEEKWAPKSFIFIMKFFTFKDLKTDVLTCDGTSQCQSLVKYDNFSGNKGQKQPIYNFTVDPSRLGNPKILQQDFVNYLINDYVTIQILTENHLQVGHAAVQLSGLLRGNKSQVLVAKQAKIFRQQEYMGAIQMLIKNQKEACYGISGPSDSIMKKGQVKKKVLSSKPLQLPDRNIPVNQGQSQQKKMMIDRQQRRIENYKKKMMKGEGQKGSEVNRINQYKQKKMQQYTSKIIEERH